VKVKAATAVAAAVVAGAESVCVRGDVPRANPR